LSPKASSAANLGTVLGGQPLQHVSRELRLGGEVDFRTDSGFGVPVSIGRP